jgi:putative transposase
MDRQIRDARVNPLPGWTWLADLPAQATQQVLKQYLNAWNRCSSGVSKPPKFKKGNAHMAVDAPQASALKIARLNRHWGEVRILLVGRVRFRWTGPCQGFHGTVLDESPAPIWSRTSSGGTSASESKNLPLLCR